MKRQRIKAFFCWLFFVLLIGAVFLFRGSRAVMAGMLLWLLLPFVTWGINAFSLRNVTAQLILPSTAGVEETFEGRLVIKKAGFLLAGGGTAELCIRNMLTGEEENSRIAVSVGKKGAEVLFRIESEHCGCLRVRLHRLVFTDWFGFLPAVRKRQTEESVFVLPRLFDIQLSMQAAYAREEEAQYNLPEGRGRDVTEVASLKDYEKGDPLRAIHWKLSLKRNTLIVKEPGAAADKTLLLFWDKHTGMPTGMEMHAMAEVAASVARAVTAGGMTFVLGYTGEAQCIFEEIKTEESLIGVLPDMIKTGAGNINTAMIRETLSGQGQFGRILYLAKEVPQEIQTAGENAPVFLVCTPQAAASYNVHCFGTESYREDLRLLEI